MNRDRLIARLGRGRSGGVRGDADRPAVSVNPLSALAPGFLRKIVAQVGKVGGDPAPRSDGEPRFKSGVMAKYARLVSSAASGAVTS